MLNKKKILLIGYGNPGRLDDGLGPAFAEAIEALGVPGVTVEANYQLTVEDADAVAKHDIVVFADADTAGAEPFWVKEIHPGPPQVSFSSHSISPEGVLAMARDLFHAAPKAFLLGIRGYEFNEFGQTLSPRAKANLNEAIEFWRDACEKGLADLVDFVNNIREIRPDGASPRAE
ncbi:MAG: hydrogenase maturation protease [Phycisphaerae bacterium]|nr:hydrogenase maturation protease [Phycisphaerae bacterium]